MPDRDYYLDQSDWMKQTRAAYVAHLEKMFTLAGEPNGSARARALLDFETKIATVHWTRIDSRDATKIYNKMLVAELQKLAPGFDFATYIRSEEHTSELQSLMRTSYAVFCLKKKNT